MIFLSRDMATTMIFAAAAGFSLQQPPKLSSVKHVDHSAANLQNAFAAAALAATLSFGGPDAAFAKVGTNVETIPLSVQSYAEITCPESLRQGRAGGALGAGAGGSGIAQKCVQVSAKAANPSKNDFLDVGVFGLVSEAKTSMSVLGNGQDGKNDAGQFAMIDKIPAGDSVIEVRSPSGLVSTPPV